MLTRIGENKTIRPARAQQPPHIMQIRRAVRGRMNQQIHAIARTAFGQYGNKILEKKIGSRAIADIGDVGYRVGTLALQAAGNRIGVVVQLGGHCRNLAALVGAYAGHIIQCPRNRGRGYADALGNFDDGSLRHGQFLHRKQAAKNA